MPIYQYLCEACHRDIEVLQKISDAPLQECPECGAHALRKKVTAAAFRLKGKGWYETDFKSGDKKKNLAEGVANSGSGDSAAGGEKKAAGGEKSTAAGDKPGKSSAAGESKPTS